MRSSILRNAKDYGRNDISRRHRSGDITITWICDDEVELRVSNYASIDRRRICRFRVMPSTYVYELDFEEKWHPVLDEGLKPFAGSPMRPCKDLASLAKVIEREYNKIRKPLRSAGMTPAEDGQYPGSRAPNADRNRFL